MVTKVEIKEREKGGIIEIEIPAGGTYRITFSDNRAEIKVQTVLHGMVIQPCVSNEVIIYSK